MRIAPNSNIIGGHSACNMKGVQRTLRLSRIWRDDFRVAIGPLRYEFVEPLRAIRMVLEPNESGMSYDVLWRGLAPPHLGGASPSSAQRAVHDRSEPLSSGGDGHRMARIDGKRFEMCETAPWGGSRDHSWGLYESRPPLAGAGKWLAPAPPPPLARALRFSCFLEGEGFSCYFHFHEGPDGERVPLTMRSAYPWRVGSISVGTARCFASSTYEHDLQWRTGTRSVTAGRLSLTDQNGGVWKHEFDVKAPPHVLGQIGYHVGAWRDGGTIHTYHGASPAMEWDEFDFSSQPCKHTFRERGRAHGVWASSTWPRSRPPHPDGKVTDGRAQFEVFLNGRYSPYGFEAQSDHGGLTGRGLA